MRRSISFFVVEPSSRKPMIDINGMAHVILTVLRYDKAPAFYAHLMPVMGLETVFDNDGLTYFVGARTAVGIQPCKPEFAGERFEQGRVGLHHICLRARSREDVDKVDALLRKMDAHIVAPASEVHWAPGYYYVLFEESDGIRLEVYPCARTRRAGGKHELQPGQ